jgi:hypothetical protein
MVGRDLLHQVPRHRFRSQLAFVKSPAPFTAPLLLCVGMGRAPDVDYFATSSRPDWKSLPAALHEALAVALGTELVNVGNPVSSGFTGGFAARAQLADGRRVFIKAAPEGLHAYEAYQREAEVVPQLPTAVRAPAIITTAHTPRLGTNTSGRPGQAHLSSAPADPSGTPDSIGSTGSTGTPRPTGAGDPADTTWPGGTADSTWPGSTSGDSGLVGTAQPGARVGGAGSSDTSSFPGGARWFAVVSEWVDGRMPGAPWTEEDFGRVTAACEEMAEVLTPSPLEGLGRFADLIGDDVGVPAQILAGEREMPGGLQGWVPRVLSELVELVGLAPDALSGDSATHSDLRPDNLLIDDSGICWTIDWNWLTLGPRWIDWVGLLPLAQHHGIDTFTAISRSPLTAGVPKDHLDSFVAVIAAYMMKNADAPPPPGCTPALRDHQRLSAWTFLDWLAVRRGWPTVDV